MSSGGGKVDWNSSLNSSKKKISSQFEESKVSTEDSYHYKINPGIPKPMKKIRQIPRTTPTQHIGAPSVYKSHIL